MKNFIIRTLTGIAIVAVQVLCTYLSPLSLAGLFLLLTALTVNEFLGILAQKGEVKVNRPIVIMGSCYLFFAFWLNCLTDGESLIVFAPYLIFLLYSYIKELYASHPSPIVNLGAIMLSQMYIVLPLSLINVLAFKTKSFTCFSDEVPFYVIPLAIYIFIWANDTGAYLSGSLLGKHKLFPRISPKKSWEGFAGGIVGALAMGAIGSYVVGGGLGMWLGLALVVAITSVFGDLVESMFKREAGIKDSGRIMPGHGGILDRFDALLISSPFAFVYLIGASFVIENYVY